METLALLPAGRDEWCHTIACPRRSWVTANANAIFYLYS
jgi:hypothetical protein